MRKASQRKDGRWDYSAETDGESRPVGYCAGWSEVSDAEEAATPGLRKEREKLRANKAKFHKGGHDTLEEACACFRGFLLDTTRRAKASPQLHPCDFPGCQGSSDAGVTVDGELRWHLCKPHRNREAFELLMPQVGEVFLSPSGS